MQNLPWFALYVKPRHEKNVALILKGKGYETFLPTYRNRVKYNKVFELPLFPSYLFCRLEPRDRLPVISTPGVFSIVGNGNQPEPIAEREIKAVKAVLEADSAAIPWPYVVPGQEIIVKSSPFQGVQGVVVDGSNGKWLVVSVNVLQRSVAVKLDRELVCFEVPFGAAGCERTQGFRDRQVYTGVFASDVL